MTTSDFQGTLNAIDAATGCQQCQRPLLVSHPYQGDFQEPLCDRHTTKVRGALHVLGIGHAGMNVPEPTACVRCLDDRPPTHRARFPRRIDARGNR